MNWAEIEEHFFFTPSSVLCLYCCAKGKLKPYVADMETGCLLSSELGDAHI